MCRVLWNKTKHKNLITWFVYLPIKLLSIWNIDQEPLYAYKCDITNLKWLYKTLWLTFKDDRKVQTKWEQYEGDIFQLPLIWAWYFWYHGLLEYYYCINRLMLKTKRCFGFSQNVCFVLISNSTKKKCSSYFTVTKWYSFVLM